MFLTFLGFKPPSQSTSLPASDSLRNLYDELRELRSESKRLQTGLPRIINSIERRQRVLEAHVDALASRGIFMAFQEAGDENLKRKLKALHVDLEQLKHKVGYVAGGTVVKIFFQILIPSKPRAFMG